MRRKASAVTSDFRLGVLGVTEIDVDLDTDCKRMVGLTALLVPEVLAGDRRRQS